MKSTSKASRLGPAVATGLAVLALGLLTSSPATAVTAPFLGGTWVNQADTASSYRVSQNYFRDKLYIDWFGTQTHSGLRGSFTGTLDGFGKAYNGTFHVEEGSTVVDGTGRVVISAVDFHGVPLLRFKLEPNGGSPTSLTLEILYPDLKPPPVGPKAPVKVDVNCDGSSSCSGDVAGDAGGNPDASDSGSAGASVTASHKVRVAYAAFKLGSGGSKVINLRLNKTGRNLLAKRGSLKVRIVITMNKSTGLPPRTVLGTVTFRKR
jgi:hypothetical protein